MYLKNIRANTFIVGVHFLAGVLILLTLYVNESYDEQYNFMISKNTLLKTEIYIITKQ